MGLSVDLISQFAKITNDKTKKSKETVMYGKAVKYGENIYVKLDGSDMLTPIDSTVEVINVNDIPDASGEPNVGDVEHGDKVMVTIRNHVATITGNIDSPAVRFDTVKNVSDKVDEQNSIINNQNTIINNQNSRITTMESDVSTVKSTVNTQNSKIETLNSDVSTINSTVNTMNSTISTMNADIEIYNSSFTIENDVVTGIKGIDGVEWINTETISANNAKIENLDAAYANIDKLVAEKATIEDLNAVNAKIENIEATTADIGNLQADVAYINELMFDNASGKSIQTSFSNAVVAQLGAAQIKSAMIDTVSASKITSGDIYTNNVHVLSEDGKLLISDETIQISDENRVRVQIGKDAAGDYSINIWDTNGNLMFSEGGITDNAIKQAIIRNDMVSDTANISASKLDISSLFTEINQNGTETIKSNKIYLDDKAQTLNVAFTQMTTDVEDLSETVSSQGTDISAIQGQISSKVWQQDINAATNTMNTKYSELSQTVDGINATVNNHTTKFSDVDKDIEYVKSNYATLEVTDEKIATQVKSITTTTDGLAQRVSSAESTITQHTDQIASKVSQTDYDSLSGRVSTAESTITQHTDQIASKVSQTEHDALTGRVSSAESTITQHTEQIATKVSQTDYNNKVSQLESSITQNAGDITLKVNAEDYENGISGINDQLANNYTTTTDLEENYVKSGEYEEFKVATEAALSVTQDSINGYVTETNTRIENIDGDLQEKFNTITKYFTFDVDGLTIGQQNSAYKIVIDNDRYTMFVNDREILWIDSKTEEVHTPNLSVTDQFKMLGYKVGNETNDVNDTINWEFVGGE